MIDISEIIAMAVECGCFKYGLYGQPVICQKCADAAKQGKQGTE